MEIKIDERTKTAEVWLSKAESRDQAFTDALGPVCAVYKNRKYVVAVYESGGGDLFAATKDLLLRNRQLLT